jgi:predicted dehydrogenase
VAEIELKGSASVSSLPIHKPEIRLAMLGMVEGNGHPYSWSAIFNGYDRDVMARCPFPVIPVYLGKQPAESFGIPGARLTHIWTDSAADAEAVAKASLIPNILSRPEEAIGLVDAVIIPTDKGHEHVGRARPFIEAGVPVFIDKPLVDNVEDLRTFLNWAGEGRPLMSSSCMRYAKEFLPYRESTRELGQLRLATITIPKSWERYGIHGLEGVYPIFGPGFISARNTGSEERNIVHFKHRSGADIIAAVVGDLYGAFGALAIYGTAGHVEVAFADTFYAFKMQLDAFIQYLRTGTPPFPFSETVELMKMLIAGARSREERGREVFLEEIV